MSKSTNHSTLLKSPKKKRTNTQKIGSNHYFSWRNNPISEAMVNHMTEKLFTFVQDNPQARTISQFFFSCGISRQRYYELLHKWPDLKEAHEKAMIELGERLWLNAVDRKADWSATRHRLYKYGDEFKEDFEFHAKLKAEADKNAQATTQYITIPTYLPPKSDEQP